MFTVIVCEDYAYPVSYGPYLTRDSAIQKLLSLYEANHSSASFKRCNYRSQLVKYFQANEYMVDLPFRYTLTEMRQ